MSVRTDLRDEQSGLAYEVLSEFGVTVDYYPVEAGTDDVIEGLVAGISNDEMSLQDVMATDSEVTVTTFLLPIQDHFPPASGVNVGDKIVYDGETYASQVRIRDSLKGVYRIRAERVHVRNVK